MRMDDLKIIELVANKDEQAIWELQNKYGNYCYVVARNILSAKEDCEECLNEVWLKAWFAMQNKMPSNLRLFLATITKNLAYDYLRKTNTQKRGGDCHFVSIHELSDMLPLEDTVESRLNKMELSNEISFVLNSVPIRDKIVFLSRYQNCCTYREISRATSIDEACVKQIIYRTRRKLKKHLRQEGYHV